MNKKNRFLSAAYWVIMLPGAILALFGFIIAISFKKYVLRDITDKNVQNISNGFSIALPWIAVGCWLIGIVWLLIAFWPF